MPRARVPQRIAALATRSRPAAASTATAGAGRQADAHVAAASSRRIDAGAINRLASGPRIGDVHRPDNTLQCLSQADIDALASALRGMVPGGGASGPARENAVRQTLRAFADELHAEMTGYDEMFVSHPAVAATLGDAGTDALRALMRRAHMRVSDVEKLDASGRRTLHLRVYFSGSEKWQDAPQAVRSVLGATGPIDEAARQLGEQFAALLPACGARLEWVSGLSMGGASAQTFLAALESRLSFDRPPAMLLLDPQLLNDAQARHARRGGPLPVDFEAPRGLAITLDLAEAPHRSLVSKMKGLAGYRSPGLTRLKLGLLANDGPGASGPCQDRACSVTTPIFISTPQR